MAKISIIVPVYNAINYLEQTIKCLINQTYQNLEIILVDDGSTDGTGELCDLYQRNDSRIKVVHQKNQGVSAARNTGLAYATGDYLGFVDSDDYLCLEMMEILIDNLKKTKSDVSVCNYLTYENELPVFDTTNNYLETFNVLEVLKDLLSDGKITNFLWNKLFKRELFTEITFPVGKIYEDMYVLPQVLEKAKKVCYTDAKLYGYYQRANSYVNTYTLEKNDNYLDFAYECYKLLSKYPELQTELEVYRCYYMYSAFLQAAKSHCLEIIKSKRMQEVHQEFRRNFKLSRQMTFKRKILYYLLYINKILFYNIVTLIK